MRVRVKHGMVKYFKERFNAGDELDVTEHFFNACPGRFIAIDAPAKKKRTRGPNKPKPELRAELVIEEPEGD